MRKGIKWGSESGARMMTVGTTARPHAHLNLQRSCACRRHARGAGASAGGHWASEQLVPAQHGCHVPVQGDEQVELEVGQRLQRGAGRLREGGGEGWRRGGVRLGGEGTHTRGRTGGPQSRAQSKLALPPLAAGRPARPSRLRSACAVTALACGWIWVAWETRERLGIWVRTPASLATIHSAAAGQAGQGGGGRYQRVIATARKLGRAGR